MAETQTQTSTGGNRCERCNRQLKDPSARYGWRCAEILGMAQDLNYSGDEAFTSYMLGIDEANAFLSENDISTNEINLAKFYESFAKKALAAEMKNNSLLDLANEDIAESLFPMRDWRGNIIYQPSKAPSASEMLNTKDIYDYQKGSYSTTSFTDNEFSPDTYFLQQALNNHGVTDKFGNMLKEDGIFGAKTQFAADSTGLYDFTNYDIKDYTRLICRELFRNSKFSQATKDGEYSLFFKAAGFVRTKDLNGTYVYHATPNAWQQVGGYNDFYDTVFDYATKMNKEKFVFSSGGVDYNIWAWKGDYLNLGAGAELGIYSNKSGILGQFDVMSPSDEHWLVDTNLAMEMSMSLTHKGKEIIRWDPKQDKDYGYDKVWWVTGFNPNYSNVNAEDLTAVYTLKFNDSIMYNDFYKKNNKDTRWNFNPKTRTAELTFK